MDIEIQTQHAELHPRWRDLIDRHAAKLTEICGEIIRLHVTLVHNTHHQTGHEEVRLLATVPRDTLKVHKTEASMGDALHAAFSVMERELKGFVDRRRGT